MKFFVPFSEREISPPTNLTYTAGIPCLCTYEIPALFLKEWKRADFHLKNTSEREDSRQFHADRYRLCNRKKGIFVTHAVKIEKHFKGCKLIIITYVPSQKKCSSKYERIRKLIYMFDEWIYSGEYFP